jgi:hypothetical protein
VICFCTENIPKSITSFFSNNNHPNTTNTRTAASDAYIIFLDAKKNNLDGNLTENSVQTDFSFWIREKS